MSSRKTLDKPRGLQDAPGRLDVLARSHRRQVEGVLKRLVRSYHPLMLAELEYSKMVELSTKMVLVGRACTLIGGQPFDGRHMRIAALYGACCFLGDSFLDDFGEAAAREYLERYELLLTKGWFELRNDRERLFYVILARLFSERDMLDPLLRQAVFSLFLTQKRDVELRAAKLPTESGPRRALLRMLRECARDRSGHAITLLAHLLVPGLPLRYASPIYLAGSLIMHIDDHGDCHYDRHHRRVTYMNQVRDPARRLGEIYRRGIDRIERGLPQSRGRELMIAFLGRYYHTRLRKNRLERGRGGMSWTVYA
ncbi:MAG: hypothetical protein ABSG65_00640 [Bryobacteraceae bacterium]